MKIHFKPLLLVWSAWLVFYPTATAAAQTDGPSVPAIPTGIGLVIGLVLIGLAFVLARRGKKG